MTPLPIRLVTATLAPGDAIGNYIMSLRRMLQQWGARVELYADRIAPAYRWLARPTVFYPRGGGGLLWYHYSIYSENLTLIEESADYRLLDYHGITPPHLFSGENEQLAALCRRGLDELPAVAARSDYLVAHSSYTTGELRRLGLEKVFELPLFVDTVRFEHEDEELAALLARGEYLLFVGRIVPQKDIGGLLEIFARVSAHLPDLFLVLAGSRDMLPGYQAALGEQVTALNLSHRVLFTGQVNDAAILAALYRHARLTIIASAWESFCVPVAESLAFGTPVAVSDVPPLPEVGGPAALVFDRQEPAMAARKIVALLEDNAAYGALREATGRQAPRYSEEALAANTSRLLQQIAADLAGRPLRHVTGRAG